MEPEKNIMGKANLQRRSTRELPAWRLHLMRGLYLLTFVGLVFDSWSVIFYPEQPLDTLSGVAYSFWASYALLMGVGVRFPVKMIPLLFLQLIYKSAWIIGTFIPAKSAGLLNENLESFFWICVAAILLDLIVIPWSYVYSTYVKGFFKVRIQVFPKI